MTQDLIQSKAKTLKSLLEVSRKEIEAALPRHLTADRMLRIAMTEARKNPALLECTQASFLGAIIQTSQLGLEPGGALGHAYLVPFKNKSSNTREVQLIIGYKGMIELAYRAPKVSHIVARAVYDGDTFNYQFGLNEKLDHLPDPSASGKKLTHVYAVVFLKEGGKIFDVMEAKEIEAARSRSKSPDKGPWDTDYEAMAKKSLIRRMFRFMPVSIELQQAVGLDELQDAGESQHNADVIETEGKHVEQSPADKLNAEAASQPETPSEGDFGAFIPGDRE